MDDFPVDALSTPEYDTSDPEQVAQAERMVNLRAEQEREHVRAVLSTYEGRAFFWILLSSTGALDDSPTIFPGEMPMTMAWNEGRRSVGMWGRDWVFTAAPEMYMVMKREAVEREWHHADVAGLRNGNTDEG